MALFICSRRASADAPFHTAGFLLGVAALSRGGMESSDSAGSWAGARSALAHFTRSLLPDLISFTWIRLSVVEAFVTLAYSPLRLVSFNFCRTTRSPGTRSLGSSCTGFPLADPDFPFLDPGEAIPAEDGDAISGSRGGIESPDSSPSRTGDVGEPTPVWSNGGMESSESSATAVSTAAGAAATFPKFSGLIDSFFPEESSLTGSRPFAVFRKRSMVPCCPLRSAVDKPVRTTLSPSLKLKATESALPTYSKGGMSSSSSSPSGCGFSGCSTCFGATPT
mmetsp:Transcript_78927/g.169126  ORF Transcript_78927/g.169126 Transcript_78927/m.169126 type:complete len:279 (-) Transcript_78927:61-897(-)